MTATLKMGEQVRVARFEGFCPQCRGSIAAGSDILWAPGQRARHVVCPEVAPVTPLRNGPPKIAALLTQPPAVKPGYYTVLNTDGTHATFRIKTLDSRSRHEGKTKIERLTGPMNTTHYTAFAWVAGTEMLPFKAVVNAAGQELGKDVISTWVAAAKVLFGMSYEDREQAGFRYAMESRRCYHCNAELTHPESIVTGLGPICGRRRRGGEEE
jgi:hypothetical protein